MLKIICIFAFIIPFSKQYFPLPSYELDVGFAPDPNHPNASITQRYFINKTTSDCEEFLYLGMGGNLNNYAKKSDCEAHKTYTPYDQANSCTLEPDKGACEITDTRYKIRFYHAKNKDPKLVGHCQEFHYSGCGGNPNNFLTKEECEMACKVDLSDERDTIDSQPVTRNGQTFYLLPNKFDCSISYEVDTAQPRLGIVPDYENKQCHYHAFGNGLSNKREIKHLSQCVSLCFGDNVVEACKQDHPHQRTFKTDVNSLSNKNQVKRYYYFSKSLQACLPYYSLIPESAHEPDKFDPNINRFKSVDLCMSYCPAIKHYTHTEMVSVCQLPLSGDVQGENDTTNGNLKLKRYYFKYEENNPSTSTCVEFVFGGLNMNLNNFESLTECTIVCDIGWK